MAATETNALEAISKSEARARVLAQDRLDFIMSFVDIAEASGDPDSKYPHPNQIFCISEWHPFQGTEKGRQEGHSFAFAADSIARAVLEKRSQSVHISTDKWEAQKKQIYCLRILESLRRSAQQHAKLKSESKNRLEFENGSIIDFLACRPPRGADRGSIYLDEMAFMPQVEAILKAALGCTTHGGYIRVGSTHCGASTEFYKIVRNAQDEWGNQPYAFWSKGYFPWWTCPSLCIDVEAAIREAPHLTTPERVEKFGKDNIKNLFLGYPVLADFQEEFECMVVDEAHAFFPLSLIHACIPPKGIDEFFEFVIADGGTIGCLEEAKSAIRRLKHACRNGLIPGELGAAQDFGRHHDKDAVIIGNHYNNNLCLRVVISMSNMPFERKEELWHFIQAELPITLGYLDATKGSFGEPMGEKMFAQYGQRSMMFEFTNQSKALLATDMKIRMERVGLTIPEPVPTIIRQIHSIKKSTTIHGHITFGVEENKEHHGDIFWAIAMLSGLFSTTPEVYVFPIKVAQRQSAAERYNPGGVAIPGFGVNPNGLLVPGHTLTPQRIAALTKKII